MMMRNVVPPKLSIKYGFQCLVKTLVTDFVCLPQMISDLVRLEFNQKLSQILIGSVLVCRRLICVLCEPTYGKQHKSWYKSCKFTLTLEAPHEQNSVVN